MYILISRHITIIQHMQTVCSRSRADYLYILKLNPCDIDNSGAHRRRVRQFYIFSHFPSLWTPTVPILTGKSVCRVISAFSEPTYSYWSTTLRSCEIPHTVTCLGSLSLGHSTYHTGHETLHRIHHSIVTSQSTLFLSGCVECNLPPCF
jgi:hypothetical protein